MIIEPYETAMLSPMPDSEYTREHILLLQKLDKATRPMEIRKILKEISSLKRKYSPSERIEFR